MHQLVTTTPDPFFQRLFRKGRSACIKLISRSPILGDFYHQRRFRRHLTACQGVFQTFAEAERSLPNAHIGYSPLEEVDPTKMAQYSANRRIGQLDSVDYPVLPWLKIALEQGAHLFDFGGNVGVSYYAFQSYINYPTNLRWVVCEIAAIAAAGEALIAELAQTGDRQTTGLSFTTEFAEAEGSDILFSMGALQYVETSLSQLLTPLKQRPQHLIINHVPFYDGETFVTLQNIGYGFAPYKIQNREAFLTSLYDLGYELIDEWKISRTCYIPFHPKRKVNAYYGFYLRSKDGDRVNGD
jgi:putative methyltransferase (TIGR04325 family)